MLDNLIETTSSAGVEVRRGRRESQRVELGCSACGSGGGWVRALGLAGAAVAGWLERWGVEAGGAGGGKCWVAWWVAGVLAGGSGARVWREASGATAAECKPFMES